MFDVPKSESMYLFVVDTDSYAGNFEREMVAFMTGRVGECGVGEEIAEAARVDLGEERVAFFEDAVRSLPDDHGCHRPASIYGAPKYNSVVMVFETMPEAEIIVLLKDRAANYCKSPPSEWVEPMALIGCRLIELKVSVVETIIAT